VTGVVYLGGGGTAQDELLVWQEMFSSPRRLLYWPFALPDDMLPGAEKWLRDQVSHHRFRVEIETWTTLEGRRPAELDDFDLLFVGGGNTFFLLQQLQVHGFVVPVRRWVGAGGHYYGGSAGAVLATDSIAIAGQADSNEVGLLDLAGLGLLPGVDLLPHYAPDQLDLARSWSRDHGRPVVAVPEAAGLVIEDGAARAVGPEAVWTVTDTSAVRHVPGSRLPLAR
jgi:dipeptidase E